MSVTELSKKLATGELTSVSIVRAYREAYEADKSSEKPLHGYIEFLKRQNKTQLEQTRRAPPEIPGPYLACPLRQKIIFLLKEKRAPVVAQYWKAMLHHITQP